MDYQGPQVAPESVVTFFCSKCEKAFVSKHTFDQPCPTCGTGCADPREARVAPDAAIKAHEAAPKSHAAGTGLVFVNGKWVAPASSEPKRGFIK